MKFKKLTALVLTAAMALGIFVAPAMEAKAAPNWNTNWNSAAVYTTNRVKDMSHIGIQTPQNTVKLYSALSWEQLECNIGVRLTVTNSECGPAAATAFSSIAASLGGSFIKALDMDMEMYHKNWSKDIAAFTSPIRVDMTLPAGSDLTKDYAIISVKDDGTFEILADLDPEPSTITVDSLYFDTFAIISGPKGAFANYVKPSLTALDTPLVSNYVKKINSSIDHGTKCANVYDIGIATDAATAKAIVGNKATIEIEDCTPGPLALAGLQQAFKASPAKRISYFQISLKDGYKKKIDKTSQKMIVTITVPFTFPAYADYAVAVVNSDGSVTIHKDIDANDNTVSILTDEFRTYGIMWAPKGAMAAY